MAVKYFANTELDKGIITNESPIKVPWSTGRNVRFRSGFVEKIPGRSYIQQIPTALPIRAMFTFLGTDGVERTIVCCDSIVYAYNADFSSYTTITPSPAPSGSLTDEWTFALVAGLPILTNGKDAIWKWASYAGALTALTGAPTPTGSTRISSCMHRLVVSGINEQIGVDDWSDPAYYDYTGRIRWSEAGNPENWTVDMTNKSGYFDLMQYMDGESAHQQIKAQLSDQNKMYFFTERGLWFTDFSQPTKGFFIAGKEAELIGARAVCRREGMIYWIGKQDFYSAAGGSAKPIGLPIRNHFLTNLNQAAASKSFAFHNRTNREIWFCVPTGVNNTPDTAYILNYELELWTIADVDFFCHSETDIPTLPYDIVGNQNGEILKLDDGNNGYYGGASLPINGVIETGDMHFGAPDFVKRVSDVIAEPALQDLVNELMIQIGVRYRLSDDIRWSDPVPFTLGVSDFCDFNNFRKDGKYVRIRFFSDQLNTPWSLSGYSVKYELGGTR